MSEGERVSAWLILLLMVGLGALVYQETSRNERMAREGFLPLQRTGSSEIFWFRPEERQEKTIKGF